MKFLFIVMILFALGLSAANETSHFKSPKSTLDKFLSSSLTIMQDNFYSPSNSQKSSNRSMISSSDNVFAITFWIIFTIIILSLIKYSFN